MYDELEILESTVVHPIRFFENLYTYDKLLEFVACYKERMPNKNDPDDFYNQFIVTINSETLTWEYEYEKCNPNDETKEWGKTIITLESKFNKFSRDQYFNSKIFINENIDFTDVTKSKNYLRRIIKKLLLFNKSELKELEKFRQYFEVPMYAIIRYIYTDLTTIAPSQKIDSKIPYILSLKELSRHFIDTKRFETDLAYSFDKLNLKLGSNAIKLISHEDTALFKIFLLKDLSSLKNKIIHFNGEVGVINFFLTRVILDSRFQLNYIESLKIIQINGFFFEAKKGSKEKSRITSRNEHKQSIIEDHLDEYIH